MSVDSQLISGPVLEAWQRMLRAHFVIARELDLELQAEHNMTLSDYDALVQLRDCEESALKMSELSRRTMLTRSGMTRLVQGLEKDGLVERRPCNSDARVSYAALTEHGQTVLAAARETHHTGIRRTFADHFTPAEAEQLAALLGQIPGALDADEPLPCGGGE